MSTACLICGQELVQTTPVDHIGEHPGYWDCACGSWPSWSVGDAYRQAVRSAFSRAANCVLRGDGDRWLVRPDLTLEAHRDLLIGRVIGLEKRLAMLQTQAQESAEPDGGLTWMP